MPAPELVDRVRQAARDIQLAAVDGHHVPGTAYHWRHNWHPLDVRTALLNRKKAAARELHAKGAPHFIPEADEKKFHQGVKPLPGGLHPGKSAPKEISTPFGKIKTGDAVKYARPDGKVTTGDVLDGDGSGLKIKNHEDGKTEIVPHYRLVPKEEPKAPKPPAAPEPVKPEPPKVAPEPPAEPSPAATMAGREKVLKAEVKKAGGLSNLHTLDDAELVRLDQLSAFVETDFGKQVNERVAVHHQTRAHIHQQHVVQRKATHDLINEKLKANGQPERPFAPYSQDQLRDLEKRTVASIYRIKNQKAKADAAKRAREEARQKAEANPERLSNLQDELEKKYDAQHGEGLGRDYYGYSPEDLDALAAVGDPRAAHVAEYVRKREKKRAAGQKAIQERKDRAAQRNREGDPVSKAVVNKTSGKTKTGVEEALAAIDAVHHDGELTPIPVKPSAATKRYGQYSRSIDPAADVIDVSGGGDHHASTFAHEVGHWLDARVMNDGTQNRYAFMSESAANGSGHMTLNIGQGEASPPSPEWAAWWQAVHKSEGLNSLRGHGGDLSYRGYATTPREIWARSYAQYIATRSGSANMQQQIGDIVALRALPTSDRRRIMGFSQWEDVDFAPIAAAIDGILAAKGWKK